MTARAQHGNRRRLLAALGGWAAACAAGPAMAQSAPLVGFLRNAPFEGAAELVAAFRAGLVDAGYVDGTNVALELHGEGSSERLAAIIADLVRRGVAVIFGNSASALMARSVTATVPIVFAGGGDPVREGLVASLSRPGGNVTGVNFLNSVLVAKQFELLRELLPAATNAAFMFDPSNGGASLVVEDARVAAAALGIGIVAGAPASEAEIDAAFASFAQQGVAAVVVAGAGFFVSRQRQIVELARRYGLPAIYENRAYVAAGGLMSYGGMITEAYRLAAGYVARILRGARPSDLPVVQGTRFELVVNLRVARATGVAVPPAVLARADEVIE
jgi:putative ABC transport system substrate-binding protein